jgi:hypothetical protein
MVRINFWFMLMMLMCWAYVSLHTTEKNTDALLIASKDTELEGNTDKTKYTVMSRDQNAECGTKLQYKAA